MDVGRVVKELQESVAFFRCRVTGDMYDKWLHASVDALALLKAQEPVKPVFERQFMTSIEIYDCGKCGTSLGAKGIAKYCMKCG